MSLHVFHGGDLYSAREETARIRDEFISGDLADLNVTTLDGGKLSLDDLIGACEAFPFMASHRLVVVEELLGRVAAAKQAAAEQEDDTLAAPSGMSSALIDYLPRLPDQAILVFLDSKRLDTRSALLKAIAKLGEVREFAPKKRDELEDWIRSRCKASKIKMSAPAIKMLADFVGGDLYQLSQELDKLSTYAGPVGSVEPRDVELLVADVRESAIFNLTDALVAHRTGTALTTAHDLVADGRPVPWILSKIAQHFREIIMVKEGLSQGWSVADVQQRLRVKEYPAKKLMEQARQHTIGELQGAYQPLIEADIALKTGRARPEVALDQLIASLCR
ncbi:MAG: DNA polymerase III subunit delta [Chloroflexi bacterium]|nr:DNA polymerase III subunit delta [Chloroflexota bacterium]